MLIEYFKYISNPVSDSAKILGHLKETIAMEARYKRSHKEWSSHLANTRTIIEKASRQIPNPDEVIVLGSGLLLDIPIEFLSKHFKRVFLVDVVHLKKIDKIIYPFDNVELVTHDVTDFSQKIEQISPGHINITPSIPRLSDKTSLVISANMLSQLSLSVVKYVDTKLGFNEKEQQKLARKVMRSHIKMLSELAPEVCLITDYVRTYRDHKLKKEEQESALKGIKLPKPDRTWIWEIAPKGELEKNISMTSLVYAYESFGDV